MKRVEALQSLSREHHNALSVASRVARFNGDALKAYWNSLSTSFLPSLRAHFHEEERWLLPLLEGNLELKRRLLDDHRTLRDLMDASDNDSRKAFGAGLKAHVRFEEQELFEWLQARYQPEALLEARETYQ